MKTKPDVASQCLEEISHCKNNLSIQIFISLTLKRYVPHSRTDRRRHRVEDSTEIFEVFTGEEHNSITY